MVEVSSETASFDERYETIADVQNQTFIAADIIRPKISALPHFSEVAWWQYKQALHSRHPPADDPTKDNYRAAKRRSLAQIEHKTIVNRQTMHTMLWCQGSPSTKREGWLTVCPSAEAERDDFCALLGTPNGLSAAYLVKEHGARFGKTAIESIDFALRPASEHTPDLFVVGDMVIYFS